MPASRYRAAAITRLPTIDMSSPNPIIRSFELSEDWYYCYIDGLTFEFEGAPRTRSPVAYSKDLTYIVSALSIYAMKIIAQTTKQTKATPDAIFRLWADIDNWADYDQGIEWAKLTDTFSVGGRYTLKPKGGPRVKATILEVEPNKRFIDVSHLLGAKLKFDHSITKQNDITVVSVVMTIGGPMGWLWVKILGKNQQSDLELSTTNLIAKAEKA